MLSTITPDNYWWTWFPGAVFATLGVMTLIWKGIRYLVRQADTLKVVALALPNIEKEFSPNSGSSMRDQIDNLTRVQKASGDRMDEHIQADKQAFARQSRTNDRVEATLERIEGHLRKG